MIEVFVKNAYAETTDVRVLELAATDGVPLPPFEPGAHIDVEVGPDSVRQYSLFDPHWKTDTYRIAVRREKDGMGGSIFMHDSLHSGSRVRISKPRQRFALASSSGETYLFAGGIGITPLLCMAQHLVHHARHCILHVFARSEEHVAFADVLNSRQMDGRVHIHLDTRSVSAVPDVKTLLPAYAPGRHLYHCGPPGFMDAIADATAKWPEGSVHFERFSAPPAIDNSSSGFDMVLERSGRRLRVPEDKSILEVLRDNGVSVPTACEQGVCGTCLTRVISGNCEHRDLFMDAAEQAAGDQIAVCVSRASGTLVLDL